MVALPLACEMPACLHLTRRSNLYKARNLWKVSRTGSKHNPRAPRSAK